jgi:hypothetical protein
VALEVPGVLSVGVVLPFPGVRGLVVADGELGDLVLQVFLGLEAAAPQELAGQDAEPLLDVEPRCVLGRVRDVEPGMGLDPGPGIWLSSRIMLVSRKDSASRARREGKRERTTPTRKSGRPGGQLFGSAVEAYDAAAVVVHLTEYAE